jgi:hypothetical protein
MEMWRIFCDVKNICYLEEIHTLNVYEKRAQITKYNYSHLLACRKPRESIYVGPSIDAPWQFY